MGATIHLPLLDQIQIASPCPARWEDMTGDDRVRHCAQCDLHVHNISAMTRDEAEGVLAELSEGRVCARFFRRADGTILVQDCPVGLAKIRAGARRALLRIAALVGLTSAAGIAAASTNQYAFGESLRIRALKPFSTVCAWLVPVVPGLAPLPTRGTYITGSVVISPWTPPTPQPNDCRINPPDSSGELSPSER